MLPSRPAKESSEGQSEAASVVADYLTDEEVARDAATADLEVGHAAEVPTGQPAYHVGAGDSAPYAEALVTLPSFSFTRAPTWLPPLFRPISPPR